MDSLELLKDKSRWTIIPNVPVFIPHVRHDAEGAELYSVTEKRLSDIVKVCNDRAKAGVLGKIQIGHTRPKDAETAQPPLVGLMADYKVGRFGPHKKSAVLCNFYVDKKHEEEAKKYPFRSVEFYSETNEITAVALLKRDPDLDMGMLLYARNPKGNCYFYSSRELTMDLASEVLPDEDEEMNEEDKAFGDKIESYMKKKYPKFSEHYAAACGGMASSTSVVVPEPKIKTHYERQSAAQPDTRAAALVRENAELYERLTKSETRLASIEGDRKKDQLAQHYERQLRAMDPSGQAFDHEAELKDLREMDEPRAEKWLTKLKQAASHYERSPVGAGMIRIGEEELPASRQPQDVTEYEKQTIVDFVTAANDEMPADKPLMTFAEGVEHFRKSKKVS